MKGYILIMLMMMCQLHTTKDIKLHIESYSYVSKC